VAVYAISPQFVVFNSSFAYQTLAIPLALAAVSLIVRARYSTAPMPFLAGASVCLMAVAFTHHVTSFLTAAFLLVWLLFEGRPGRIWVAYGACAAIASTLVWAIVQRRLLTDYFGPIARDIGSQVRGGERRELFKDSAGTAARSIDTYILLYYAAVLCLIVGTLLLLAYRWWRHGERSMSLGPNRLLIILTTSVPVLLAARVVPRGGEVFDRSSSFLFLPMSILVGAYATRLWWSEEHPHFTGAEHRRLERLRAVTLVLASLAFLGGYVLGSGPSWLRLPGPYLVAADSRSIDPEALAAAEWAARELPAGSRISADKVGSILMSSTAGLWPVMKGPEDIDAPALYVARNWGPTQTDMAAAMQLRYIYVDRRLADELPHFGAYFYDGETGAGQQYTARQLHKFDKVPGIEQVYRHGPISIYDLKPLAVPVVRTGWFGPNPQVRLTTQLAVGLLTGLFLAAVMRSRFAPRIRRSWVLARRCWGPALTAAILLAAVSLCSVSMLLTGVWLTPMTFLSAGAVVTLTNFRVVADAVRLPFRRVTRFGLRTAALTALPLAIIMAVAIRDAAVEDIVKVDQILDDPAAIHVSTNGIRG
jgi:drug/metabolite transporter superfamily protein YnfA